MFRKLAARYPSFWLKVFAIVLALNLVFFALALAIDPSRRIGPFGLGLPAQMSTFIIESADGSISYPKSWVAVLTPQGNHGDSEIIAVIGVPGRGLPSVTVAQKTLSDPTLTAVVMWGESRAASKSSYVALSSGFSGSIPGIVREYQYVVITLFGESLVHCRDLYVLHDSIGLSLSFCAEETDWEEVVGTIDEMILSFKFVR